MTSTYFCDLQALSSQQRQRHTELGRKLRPLVIEFTELANGYSAKLVAGKSIEPLIREFMVLEKLCCPFFTLTLKQHTNHDNELRSYGLEITGAGDIKPFIRSEFGIPEQ